MPERDCLKCTRQKEWGCFAKPYTVIASDGTEEELWSNPAELPVTINDREVWACPRQTLREDARDWGRLLFLYGLYQKGHLPDRGAAVDQSNPLMEMFRILDDANAQCDRELAEQDKRRRAGTRSGGRG